MADFQINGAWRALVWACVIAFAVLLVIGGRD